MHARVGQLHFFAYESKLRYVRDSPEGAVKYSRQSPRCAAYPPVLRQQNAATPTIPATRCYYIPRYIYWYYARCRWGNPNNCVMETTKCVFRRRCRVAPFQNYWALINDFVSDLYLSLPVSVPRIAERSQSATREHQNENICVTLGATWSHRRNSPSRTIL